MVYFSSNKYLYVFINGVLEIPAYTLLGPIMHLMGRKKSLSMFYITCGLVIIIAMSYQVVHPDGEQYYLWYGYLNINYDKVR